VLLGWGLRGFGLGIEVGLVLFALYISCHICLYIMLKAKV